MTDNGKRDWGPLISVIRASIDLDQEVLPAVRQVAAQADYKPPKGIWHFVGAIMVYAAERKRLLDAKVDP